ncbi:5'-methylthioadenosine/adenosylhomocysteine nucleosidase [Cohnella terricola]|uniref:adenosylhomocysteine nucleosidase n=1 Tax=Cohnella terricola TaxID=1289167 RepID=A0A559JWJ2_9BACL|nr:5'-methylthioadenosine/adenosylhomocysteine nucleosidase [Cohnella terricola]TVY04246.1 5'-methylthioadenosine/adenosylhomocysteine nucleosidase [Cohnella terricola]
MKIAFIAAMAQEIGPLRAKASLLNKVRIGKTTIEEAVLDEQPLLLVESGIGKVNAAVATTILIERHRPELIINIGSAGAFDRKLNVGDVVVATEFKYGDVDATNFGYAKGQVPQMPAAYPLAARWVDFVLHTIANHKFSYAVDHGLVLTLDSFMSSQRRVEQTLHDFPTVKVSDMEGLAIVQAADQYGIPVIGIKAVSDHAGEEEGSTASFTENLHYAADTSSHFAELLLRQLAS